MEKNLGKDDKDLEEIIRSSSSEKRLFNFDDSLDYINMARLQLNKKNQFMGYLLVFKRFQTEWSYSVSSKKLVKNIGFDGSGTHCSYSSEVEYLEDFDPKFTDDIKELANNRVLISNLLRKIQRTLCIEH